MSPVKDLTLAYEALNEEGTFSEGDAITGTVTFTVTEETKVKGLKVKAKGEAQVRWTEGSGNNYKLHVAYKTYLNVNEYLIGGNGTVLPEGVHRYKFTLQIPQEDIPSSFSGTHGSIFYRLEAKMSTGSRWPTREQKVIKFVSKSFPNLDQVMCPQSGSVDKKIGVFSKGEVQMSVTVNTKVCSPGDTLSVMAKICNSSSKKNRPKFTLHQKTEYRAHSSPKTVGQSLCKMVGDTIPQNTEAIVSCQFMIPANINYTVHNCEIISVEYYLKVYLDISFAFDPEVVFPLVIVPSGFAAVKPDEAVGPYPAGAFGAPSDSDFPPPAFPAGAYPVPTGSDANGHPAPAPTQHENIDGCKNKEPQQVPPCDSSTAASSSVQYQDPTAPPLFEQEEDPPSYMSLFSHSKDTQGETGPDPKS